ncbi:MAG: hypothetical protein MJA31_02505 [Clostridia bacterium]|nr:hypothetical protein [Clostridia bacterium]
MVAFFIALPLERKKVPTTELIIPPGSHSKIQTIIKSFNYRMKNGETYTLGMPTGMGARRALLYIFSEMYKREIGINKVDSFEAMIRLDDTSKNQYLRKIGYSFEKSAMGKHDGDNELFKFYGCTYDILYYEYNNLYRKENKYDGAEILPFQTLLLEYLKIDKAAGTRSSIILGEFLDKIKERNKTINLPPAKDSISNSNEGFYINPFFAFKLSFPVNFDHVVGTSKRNDFWNIYVFLIDVLPRIHKSKKKTISWKMMHTIFCNRKSLANFKYHFKKYLTEVLEIYPQAKGKIDFDSDREYLILKYAPPPVEIPIDDFSE